MILVCDKHVNDGIKIMNIPHVKKAGQGTRCLFCKQKAIFEVYYFDLSYSIKSRKEVSQELEANA